MTESALLGVLRVKYLEAEMALSGGKPQESTRYETVKLLLSLSIGVKLVSFGFGLMVEEENNA